MENYKVLGVMSGTSLDGLDLAYCEFVKGDYWSYKILNAKTISYSTKRQNVLKYASKLSAEELSSLDHKFGKYIGTECRGMYHGSMKPDLIASHGHTVFHQPSRGFTLQIGHGADIFAVTNVPVICDFRTQDVALGGQGAPLVPIGDQMLFGNFDSCLNLGGFANISAQIDGKRLAWDICAVNVVLNYFANKLGYAFDNGGSIALKGRLHQLLFEDLQKIEYYAASPPKSLGIEWVNQILIPLLEKYSLSVEDVVHTYTSHIAFEIGKAIDLNNPKTVFVTGGGAYNNFLIEKLKQNTKATIIIPSEQMIEYKEALIFAFLGLLKWLGEINVLSSVTGAKQDHSSGVIYKT